MPKDIVILKHIKSKRGVEMRKVFFIIASILLLSILSESSTAQTSNARVKSFDMKYLGYDQGYNAFRLLVNISMNKAGHLTYIEEYYTIDGNNNPKFVSSGRYFDDNVVEDENSNFNVTFEMLRPPSYLSYTLVKAIIMFDNERIVEAWLTKQKDFNDNTNSGDDIPESRAQNIDKFEIREKKIFVDYPVKFEYSTLGTIYEVNVTGNATDDTALRVDILKGVPSLTYRPGGIIFKYFDISADNQKIKSLSIKYKVENSWLKDNNIKSLGIVRWDSDNKIWVGLSTKVIDKDNDYIYLESLSTDLTSFAIVGFIQLPNANVTQKHNEPPKSEINTTKQGVSMQVANNETKQEISVDGATQGTPQETEKEPLIRNMPGFETILGFVSIAIIAIKIKRRK